MLKEKNAPNGAEKLFKQMIDRAYAEAFDVEPDELHDPDYIPEEDEIDVNKDVEIKGR